MRLLYSVVLYCLMPLIILRLFWLSLANPAYRARIPERFGFVESSRIGAPCLWIHAVSVGEVKATLPLVNAIREKYPQFRILITTTTPTGADTVLQIYGNSVLHSYIPYDLPGPVQRFFARTNPVMLIVMETEIWPNLYYTCRSHGVPVAIANARLSSNSLAGYRKLALLARDTINMTDLVLAQSNTDADRFADLGASRSRIHVTGNLKFDAFVPADGNPQTETEVHVRPLYRNTWLAASTHAGEERTILESHQRILAEFPGSLLIIAPRHPERFAEVMKMAGNAGFSVVKKTDGQPVSADVQVFILDTLGDLPGYYAMANIAFVGGSLVAAGGHNPLEPAALGVPVIFGPHTGNFAGICRDLLDCDAAKVVTDAAGLAAAVSNCFNNVGKCQAAGKVAREYVNSNRGSADVMLKLLAPYLESVMVRGC